MADTALVSSLRISLAETWAMYFKAHSFHWNVRGGLFHQFHDMFGDLYEDLHGAVDELAERLRTLNADAPKSLDEIVAPATISFSAKVLDDAGMVGQLLKDNDTVVKALKATNDIAEDQGECGLSNFLQDRIDKHARWGWMLKATMSPGGSEF